MVAIVNPITTMGAARPMSLSRLAPAYADDVAMLAARSGAINPNSAAKKSKHKQGAPDADDVAQQAGAAAGAGILAPNIIDTSLSTAERVANFGGFLPLIAMPVGMLGGGLQKLGSKGVPLIGGLGKALSAPTNYLAKPLDETVFAAPVKAVAQGASNITAGAVSGITKATGLDTRLTARHTRLADASLGKAQQHLSQIEMHAMPDAVRGHVQSMHSAAHNVSSMSHVNAAHLEATVKQAKEGLGNIPRASRKPVKQAIKQLESAVYHHNGATSMRNVEQSIRTIPQRLGKMDLGHTIANGSFVAMSGISMASDARGFTKNLATLKQLHHDMTGENASTAGVLFGKVPTVVAEARSHLLKNILVKEGTDTVGLFVNLKGLLNPAFGGLKAMAAYMLPQLAAQGADMVMGESVLPAYQMLKNSFDPKQQMPLDYYQAFVGTMSKDIRKRGGAESPFAKAVAEQYAQMRATPEQILQEIETGALSKRIEAIIAANKAAAPAVSAHAASKEKQVLGKHTQQVIHRENGPQQSTGHTVT